MALPFPPFTTAPYPTFHPPSLPLHLPPPHHYRWNKSSHTSDPTNLCRRHRRLTSASNHTTPETPNPSSSPSSPLASVNSSASLPAHKAKYSKSPRYSNSSSHPAFRRIVPPLYDPAHLVDRGIHVGDHGVSYRLEGAPFEFQYSYTETPKVKPLALREPPFLPFVLEDMRRPWTGRKPLPKSKKELPEFDSFNLPPHGKKGVKPVQSPGPFLAGAGPRSEARTREEVLGEPLSEEEVKELVEGCLRTRRQLNIGRCLYVCGFRPLKY